MKARKSIKVLINLLPMVAIVGLGLFLFLYQKHQTSQALARPDYENSNAEYKKPAPSGQVPQTQSFQVKRVLDGDTIVLENGDSVRLCGIDAPETAKKNQPGQLLGEESKAHLEKLIPSNRTVLVMEMDRDRHHRIVGEVFVKRDSDEVLLNVEQLRSGMAYLYSQYVKSCLNESIYFDMENRAKSQKIGVWAGNYQKPWDYRRSNR